VNASIVRGAASRAAAVLLPVLETALTFAATTAIVAFLDGMSLMLAHRAEPVDMLWPARGVVLALCLLARRNGARTILLAAFAGAFIGRVALGVNVTAAAFGAGLCVADAALALCLAMLLVGEKPDFRDWRQLLKFIAVGCAAAAAIAVPASFVPAANTGETVFRVWAGAALSTSLSYAIFTPSLVLLATMQDAGFAQPMARRRIVLANLGMLALDLFVFCQAVFPGGFLIPVGLLVVTLTAEIEGTALALLITSIVAIMLTAMGKGPWVLVPGSSALRVDAVQIFLAAMTVGMVPTAAAITERRRLRDHLTRALAAEHESAKALEKSAAALRQSEELYRLLAENASDIVIRTELSGRVAYVSPSLTRILGYEPSELVGRDFWEIVAEDDRPKYHEAVREAARGGFKRAARVEYRALTKSGELRFLESAPLLGRDGRGAPAGIIDIARDVSARRAMEDALEDARQRAEEAAEAKAAFLANMSHELKTPLTSAIGFADALNDYCGLDDRARRFASGVRTASLSLLSTVNDILDYSRLERGILSYESRPFFLHELLEETLALFAVKAEEKGVTLTLSCPPALDHMELITDPDRLRQVLINLLGNAMKFTEQGSIALEADCVPRADGSFDLRCAVTDSGPGIAPERIHLLFQRFSQLEAGAERRHQGTGLGLAISKGIVEGLGGTIAVESAPGKGARFHFELPVEIVPA